MTSSETPETETPETPIRPFDLLSLAVAAAHIVYSTPWMGNTPAWNVTYDITVINNTKVFVDVVETIQKAALKSFN